LGIPLPREREFEEVILVEVLIEEMYGSDGSRPKDYERAVVVEPEANGTNKTTPGSGGRSLFKKNLTGPTLLEMSGNPTYQDLTAWSADNFRFADNPSTIRVRHFHE
jgi:hypothetical protein